MENHKIGVLNWLVIFMLGAIWGSSFILLKIGARSYNTLEIASLRMFFAGIFMLPFFVQIIKKYKLHTLKWMLVSALLGSGIPAILYAYSASRLDSNINGVINSLTPIFTLIVGIIWLKYKTGKLALLGVLIGLVGVLLLITQRENNLQTSIYAIFPLLATIMYGVNMNVVKVKLSHLPSIDILKGVFGMICIIYTPLIIYYGVFNDVYWSAFDFHFWQTSSLEAQKVNSLFALFLVGFIGSLFASLIFYRLVKQTNALFASMNTYLIPLMAMFWGWLDGEHIGWIHFISLLLILIGVYLGSKKR